MCVRTRDVWWRAAAAASRSASHLQIEARASAVVRQTRALEEVLVSMTAAAREEDDKQTQELRQRGLVVGTEVPLGPSRFALTPDVLADERWAVWCRWRRTEMRCSGMRCGTIWCCFGCMAEPAAPVGTGFGSDVASCRSPLPAPL